MSTFDGLVDEFPDIRIDYFRKHPGRRTPAACFLSHVHSDHLLGLESIKMPFVYCSAVTRNILLRMEKYPHRINFQKGILESRRQTYRHLKSILRALPMETPIELELRPRITIKVTLFDANHCPGAVMFLIEGDDKAILYTGDIRAESWWINSIVRNPVLLPYTNGHRHLDCVYLDTTFAAHDDIYKHFPSKAQGLRELLQKVDKCPSDSIFYFRAWTLGYEDVWLTLANYLRGRVHVDDYQLGLYTSCSEDGLNYVSSLVGVQVGNSIHPGYLSHDKTAIIHSCEPGMECHASLKRSPNTVWITPIISRAQDGTELSEIGAGGGFALRDLCQQILRDDLQVQQIETVIAASASGNASDISLDELGLSHEDEITIKDFVSLLSKRNVPDEERQASEKSIDPQRNVIRFPYSRHSSLSELRDLLSHFRPKDICPCTVDIATWSEDVSMESLFGGLCSQKTFKYDAESRKRAISQQPTHDHRELSRKRGRDQYDSQETASQDSQGPPHDSIGREVTRSSVKSDSISVVQPADRAVIIIDDDENDHQEMDRDSMNTQSTSNMSLPHEAFDSQRSDGKIECSLETRSDRMEKLTARRSAYYAARSCLSDGQSSPWDDLHIRSLGWKGHTEEEIVL